MLFEHFVGISAFAQRPIQRRHDSLVLGLLEPEQERAGDGVADAISLFLQFASLRLDLLGLEFRGDVFFEVLVADIIRDTFGEPVRIAAILIVLVNVRQFVNQQGLVVVGIVPM